MGVADVVLDGVGAVEHGGDAPLGPAEAPSSSSCLVTRATLQAVGQTQGGRHAGQTTADDEDVVGVQERRS